jgi:hypothetical protein
MGLKDFDYRQFLIQKGERVALGVAVALMAIMILFSTLKTAFGGNSASTNAKEIKELSDQAARKMRDSTPPTDLGNLPPDLKEVRLELVDRDWFPCPNLYFDKAGDIDRRWRRPNVLMPDEFAADVVRGAVPIHLLKKDEEGHFMVALLQMQNNMVSEASKDKLKTEFNSFRKWEKVLSRPGFGGGPPGAGAFTPGAAGAATGTGLARGGRGGGPATGASERRVGGNSWGRWGSRSATMSLKWVSEDQLDQITNARLAQDIQPTRMVVVTGAFPYRQQLEEFRRALRFDSIDALLNDPLAIPEFLGIDVQRREIPSAGEPGEWTDLPILESVRQLRIRAVGLEPEDPEMETYGIIVHPNRLVMPRPRLARDEKYPEHKLPSIQETVTTLAKSNEGDLPPPPAAKSRFEDLDPYSPDQPNTVPGAQAQAGAPATPAGAGDGAMRRRGGAAGGDLPGEGAAPRGGRAGRTSPAAPRAGSKSFAPPEKCLLRFLDVTVEPGKTYEYRVKVKIANPSFGKEELAVSAEAAADPVLVASQWRDVTRRVGEEDVPLRVSVSDELRYYAVDEKVDRPLPANQERTPVQVHRWLEEVRVNPRDNSSVVPVGNWTILERLLLHRGEYIGRSEEVEVPVWKSTLDNFTLAAHVDDQPVRVAGRIVRHKGIIVDFATDPPVMNEASVLVDFEGGKRTIPIGDGKNVVEDSPLQLLVLNSDGRLVVHSSRVDTEDPTRKERYDVWKKEITTLRERDDPRRRPGDDSFFKRGGDAGGGGRTRGNN